MDTLKTESKKELLDGDARKKYLFVCTGNTCRSPMAEAVFNRLYKNEERIAVSAGMSPGGHPLSANAKSALETIGISDFNHISAMVTFEDMAEAECVVGMTYSHAQRLMMCFPEFASKIVALPIDIEDPYGGDIDVYKLCLGQICEALEMAFSEKYENEDN